MEELEKSIGVISEGMNVCKGVIATSNEVVISGRFVGTIASTSSITIAANAYVEADIIADSVTIVGAFNGKITVRDIANLKKGSTVNGQIFYGRLNVEDGAVLRASTTIINANQFKKCTDGNKVYRSIKKSALNASSAPAK